MARRRLRELLVDSPRSAGGRTRAKRWETFAQTFPGVADMRVLDLGGTVQAWERAPVRPAHVTVLNLLEPGSSDDPSIDAVRGDACDPPSRVADATFDLVFSNSLLEHVGGHARRVELAGVVHDAAPRHWVQTPDRAFPVEPHFLFPGFQFLSIPMQAWILQRWPLVHSPPKDEATAMRIVQWTELVGRRQMEGYFPDSELLRERIAGIPKSLVAVLRG